MKKILFFALALVAGVVAFTSCDKKDGNNPDEPKNPTDVNPADYVATSWRVDSSRVDGKLDFMPHLIVDVLDDKVAVFNGSDTVNYLFEGNILYFAHNGEEPKANQIPIKQANKEFAELFFEDMKATIYMSLIPKAEGAQLPKTAENIVGTWKCQYYSRRYSQYDEASESFIWYGSKHSDPGVFYYEFKADGTFTSTNIVFAKMDEQKEYAVNNGFWAVKNGKFAWAMTEDDLNQMAEANWDDILTLTSNAFYFGSTTQSWTGTTQEFYTYYTRVK